MGLQTEQTRESTCVDVRFEHGVLVGTITAESLLDQLAICDVEEQILQELPRADQAVLVDCSNLTGPVSSQFLSVLMRLRNRAEESGLPTAVCGLSSALRSAYEVTTLTSIIPAYENQPDAIHELGTLDKDGGQSIEIGADFISRSPDASSHEVAMSAPDPPAPQVSVGLDRGVLVAKVVTKSLIHERRICDVEDHILEQFAKTEHAVLIDCSQLTHQVSSQFLSMLMRVYYQAKETSLRMGVCGLSEPLREAYKVTALSSIVPSYEDYERAIGDLRESREFGDNDADAVARADTSSDKCSHSQVSHRGPLSRLLNCDRSSGILLVLCAVALVGLGVLAGVSLNSLGLHATGP